MSSLLGEFLVYSRIYKESIKTLVIFADIVSHKHTLNMQTTHNRNIPADWGRKRLFLYAAIKGISDFYGKGTYERILLDTGHSTERGLNYKTLNSLINKKGKINPDSAKRFGQLLADIIIRYKVSFTDLFFEQVENGADEKITKLFNVIKKGESGLSDLVTVSAPPVKALADNLVNSPTDAFKGTYLIVGMNTDGLISVQPISVTENGQVDITTRENTRYRGEVQYDGSDCLSFYFHRHMTVANQFYYSHYLFSTCRISRFKWAYGVSSRLSKFSHPKAGIEILIPVDRPFEKLDFQEITSDYEVIHDFLVNIATEDNVTTQAGEALEKAIGYLQTPPYKVSREPFTYSPISRKNPPSKV